MANTPPPARSIPATVAAELCALALLVAFWAIVWWPGLLPTIAIALLGWSAKTARTTSIKDRR